MKCWAHAIGGCAGGHSGEHYISKGIFASKGVITHGFPQFGGETKSIGINSAVAKILCKAHNEALSELDETAAALARFMEKAIGQPQVPRNLSISGARLERWTLKVLFNLGYEGMLHREQPHLLEPPEHLVRYVFGDGQLQDGVGLYLVCSSIDSRSFSTGVSWNAMRLDKQRNAVVGMTVNFCGVRFVISILPGRAEKSIAAMGVVDDLDYSHAAIHFRPSIIDIASTGGAARQIKLQW